MGMVSDADIPNKKPNIKQQTFRTWIKQEGTVV
jgi:hypothetical protein